MLNRIAVMGRITRDMELKVTGNGKSMVSFSIACDRDFKPQEGEKECDFIDCVAFGKTAELICKYFSKGRMIVVDGRLRINKWKDKEDKTRYSPSVVVDSCYFGDSKRADPGNSDGAGNSVRTDSVASPSVRNDTASSAFSSVADIDALSSNLPF